MIQIRKSVERGSVKLGWLDGKHTFSFGDYYDPAHMGYGTLRVINEDVIQPDQGFGTHGHRDMEIVTYILSGALEHKDSMGNGAVMRAGEVQRMTAGTGVMHSEFNHSTDEPVRLLQIWILPESGSLQPEYEQKNFSEDEKKDRLRLIVSRDGRDDSVSIHQDTDIYASLLSAGKSVEHHFNDARQGWLQLASGDAVVNGQSLSAGDGAAVSDVAAIEIRAVTDTELLLFDMPA
ncbi:MAG: pirin family protein [Gammaproteobacteria bacterium]|nr:pirin family protein [Gammaproteobacteria bacterium]